MDLLSSKGKIYHHLSRNPHDSIAQTANACDLSHSQTFKLIKQLEKEKLLFTIPNPLDKTRVVRQVKNNV